MTKKIGLEHTIRLLVSESIGAIGTDKFKQTANSFFKPVHIAPKKGDEHPNGFSSVRASRNVQKERTSETMKEEEEIEENKIITKGGELLLKYGDEAVDSLKKMLMPVPEPKANLPAVNKGNVPKKAEPPSTAKQKKIDKPSDGEVLSPSDAGPRPGYKDVTPTKPEVKTKTQTDTKTVPQVKTQTETLPKIKTQTQTQTQTQTLPIVQPQTQTQTQTLPKVKTQTQTQSLPKVQTDKIFLPPTKTTSGGGSKENNNRRFPLAFPTLSIDPTPLNDLRGYVPTKTHMHYAKERVSEETDENLERKKIENVPRPNGTRNRTRQAEIIRKIIEEKRLKKKNNTTVEINPKINPPELDKT